jgi:hypothetical protein
LDCFSKPEAIQYHTQHLAIAKEVGDLAGVGRACRNFEIAYHSLGDFSKAIEHLTQHLAIVKEVGKRVGEGGKGGRRAAEADACIENPFYREPIL